MNIHEIAARYNVSATTIRKYVKMGILPKPVPPRGCTASYGRPHIEAMDAIYGRNGLKDTNRTLSEFAEHRAYLANGGVD